MFNCEVYTYKLYLNEALRKKACIKKSTEETMPSCPASTAYILILFSQSYNVTYMEFNTIIYLVSLKHFYFILHKLLCYAITKQN